MLTHDHDNFSSDMFTAMAGAGAKITVGKGLAWRGSTSGRKEERAIGENEVVPCSV